MPQGHFDENALPEPKRRPWFTAYSPLTSRQLNVVWGTAVASLVWHVIELFY